MTLVDRTNHHLFQPLLYQVATAGCRRPAIAVPIRVSCSGESRGNVTVLLAEVTRHRSGSARTHAGRRRALGYDHLILAAGATHSYFGHDEWEEHAPGLKSSRTRSSAPPLLRAFEAAEREHATGGRAAWLTFVVIGAGPTGVEMAGTLAEIARHTLAERFRRIDPRSRASAGGGRAARAAGLPEA